jgi:D-amino-acid dehydrogenase
MIIGGPARPLASIERKFRKRMLMHALVLGAGVVGVTTAYYLSQHGCRVTVVDRAGEVADEASYANGGQLSYTFTDALARPSFLPKLPGLFFGRQPGWRVRLEPHLVPWGLSFLGQCTTRRAEANTLAVLETALRSAVLMEELCQATNIEIGLRPAGKLVLLSDEEEVRDAEEATRLKSGYGSDATVVSVDEAVRLEPAVARMDASTVAAIYSRHDEVADSKSFAVGLRRWLEASADVTFRMNTAVGELVLDRGRAVGVRLGDDTETADAICVCMGAWSNPILRSAGVNPKIYPVRGYSVTLPPGSAAPSVSVTALKYKMVYSRINGSVRIAGFADFAGFDKSADERRTQDLLDLARSFAPEAANYDVPDAQRWGGFRPMTPDGRPRVGPTRVPGLFTNTGHGTLGWTLACASSFDAAQAMAGPERKH